ncbi:L-lactate dehydrogenase [Rothia sp. LK2588]|uniref:L-lactate dehydrogenase n=1 Tax=Rothia sp. LK2588 TaxID=3114369 RepID=UPI0034CE5512
MTQLTQKKTKLGVIGAGGVGSATAYAAMLRGSADEVVIYDINGALARAEGLDITHATGLAQDVRVSGSDDIAVLKDCDVIFVTAGARQKPGQSRLDLVDANVAILKSMLPQVMKQAPDAVLVIVTNPCDVLAVVAREITGLPAERCFASGTVLDSARLRYFIAARAGVRVRHVNASVLGEHGDSEFVYWSAANIGQVSLDEWKDEDGNLIFTDEVKAQIEEDTMRAAYNVIQGKGSTNYAIGVASVRIAEAILQGQDAILPVSSTINGKYGITGNAALSLPSIVGRGGIKRVFEVPLTEEETQKMWHSAETLNEVLSKITI